MTSPFEIFFLSFGFAYMAITAIVAVRRAEACARGRGRPRLSVGSASAKVAVLAIFAP